jgi:catechol 2,3-dioxygenase
LWQVSQGLLWRITVSHAHIQCASCNFTSIMGEGYTVPPRTSIGHVHLKVADIPRSLEFYCGLLGFELITMYGAQAAFISAGGYHHHIGLNTWYSKDAPPTPVDHAGLFHVAILYPTRKDLAVIFQRLQDHQYPFTGASDHGVSEALYLNDPDENGVELYWDRPKEQWPKKSDGSVEMYTRPLDIQELLLELKR